MDAFSHFVLIQHHTTLRLVQKVIDQWFTHRISTCSMISSSLIVVEACAISSFVAASDENIIAWRSSTGDEIPDDTEFAFDGRTSPDLHVKLCVVSVGDSECEFGCTTDARSHKAAYFVLMTVFDPSDNFLL